MIRRKSRRAMQNVFGLSLLDLLSCAFGGAVLLTVIFAAQVRDRAFVDQRSFFQIDVEIVPANPDTMTTEEAAALARLEVILELRRQGSPYSLLRRGEVSHGRFAPGSSAEIRYLADDGGVPADPAQARAWSQLFVDRAPIGSYEVDVRVEPSLSRDVEDAELVLRMEIQRPGPVDRTVGLTTTTFRLRDRTDRPIEQRRFKLLPETSS